MKGKLRLGIYKHYKGNQYEVIGIAKHSETLEELVIYRSLNDAHALWARLRRMFLEKVSNNGKRVPQFTMMARLKNRTKKGRL
jgi:cyclomaltodextrinase / maltogenic alpha-amylase / neopullulanase